MVARFLAFARPYAWYHVAGFVLLLLTNGLNLWIPWLLRDAIRAMETGASMGVITRFGAL